MTAGQAEDGGRSKASDTPTEAAAAGIRAAYRRFLRAARPRLPRRAWETPREYAERFAASFPELADAARRLTELYEPVRYGGRALNAAQDEAERLAKFLERRLHGRTMVSTG